MTDTNLPKSALCRVKLAVPPLSVIHADGTRQRAMLFENVGSYDVRRFNAVGLLFEWKKRVIPSLALQSYRNCRKVEMVALLSLLGGAACVEPRPRCLSLTQRLKPVGPGYYPSTSEQAQEIKELDATIASR